MLCTRQMIRLGDSDMEYNESFRFYMTTKIANPHFLPEVAMKVRSSRVSFQFPCLCLGAMPDFGRIGFPLQVNVINFTVTHMGLVEQLLALVVRREHPELEEQMDRLVVSISNDRRQLKVDAVATPCRDFHVFLAPSNLAVHVHRRCCRDVESGVPSAIFAGTGG